MTEFLSESEERLVRAVRARDEDRLLRVCAEIMSAWPARREPPPPTRCRSGWRPGTCSGWRVNEHRQYLPVEALPVQIIHEGACSLVSFFGVGRAEVRWSDTHGAGSMLDRTGQRLAILAEPAGPDACRFRVTDPQGRVVFEGRWQELPIEQRGHGAAQPD